MSTYCLNPFAHLIEDRLAIPHIKLGIVNLLTGEVALISDAIRKALKAMMVDGTRMTHDQIETAFQNERLVRDLLARGFLRLPGDDPLEPLMDHRVVRPIQNPALAYRSESGALIVVQTSMEQFEFSRKRDQLPIVVEETLPTVVEEVFELADGTRTLRQISKMIAESQPASETWDTFKRALEFLTAPKRQLIKLAPPNESLANPYKPFNSVPRNLSHNARWQSPTEDKRSLADFHQAGIEDASWEFDWIEPTLNHAFRFPSPVLGGLDYGAQMCASVFKAASITTLPRLNVLEVGGGTGSFARAFITHAIGSALIDGHRLNYHILELSPALIQSQQRVLAGLPIPVIHFQQDATQLELPGLEFDLIIANEVIADFQTAQVLRAPQDQLETEANRFAGEGADYIKRFDLPVDDAPDTFQLNSGVFDFLEHAQTHLAPGGRIILTEYGAENKYPRLQQHLNHNEHSIHFGHVMAAAKKLGFGGRLLTLKEFLGLDDEVLMLDGSAEQIFCLNYVFEKYGLAVPYAAISKQEFEERYRQLANRIGLTGITFSPLKSGFHYGPDPNQFMALILEELE